MSPHFILVRALRDMRRNSAMRIRALMAASLILTAMVAIGTAQQRTISVESMQGEKRLALVIGNSAYPTSPLRNPVNDAQAMARALRELGFDVLAHENLAQKEMRRAIIQFGDKLRDGGVGLFFYAGHGVQVQGRNYLVPVDADIKSEAEVEVESLDLASVLARMETAGNRLNLVILDACRDNPFARRFRSAGRGLASVDAPTGTLIAYATAPGRVALDGDAANGVYTSELLKAIRVPGLRVEDVFKRVRQGVLSGTRGEQVPWESSSLIGDFVFALGGAQVSAATPPPRPTIREEIQLDVGTLVIRSPVDGVEIFLDGARIGETRAGRTLVVENVVSGTHIVRASKQGHKEWERQVEVIANQRAEVAVNIERLAHGLRSIDGRTSIELTFENRSGATILVYWLDYQGKEVLYRQLEPGQSYRQQTYVTHPWRIRDGRPRGEIKTMVAEAPIRIVITNHDLGK